MDGEHAFATSGGSAWRRRQRRLRAFRRFVLWQSKMEVAAALDHSSGLRQRAARAEATNDAPRSQVTNVAGDPGTEFFAMSEDSDVVGGGLPPSLVDVRRQGPVLQRTVEQIVDPVP